MKTYRNSIHRKPTTICSRFLNRWIPMGILPLGVLLMSSAVLHAQQPAAQSVAQSGSAVSSARALPAVMASIAPTSAKAVEEEPQATAPRKPGDEGIKVHGHWAIDVRNSDGTLAHHTEFENSVQPDGANFILGLVAGVYSPGDLSINLFDDSRPPCSGNYGCSIVRSTSTPPGNSLCDSGTCATTLVTTFNSDSFVGGPSSLVMTGSIAANQSGSITLVQTLFGYCDSGQIAQSSSTTAPSACPPLAKIGNRILTGATRPAITVQSGQVIQVTVTISLS